jgi:uncharacterized protein YbjT (DUF2867 family)
MINDKKVLIFGATGNIGGATARELLGRGWQVRAVTRSPQGKKAQALAALGAEVVQADMEDRASLDAVFDSMKRVLSVQNWTISGVEGEVRQGKLVADAARAAQIEHLVYASAGIGEPGTGVPHFDSKLGVEAYMRKLDLPFTILRPGPFMELMTHKPFFPAMGVWGVMPKLVGWETPSPWVALPDIGKAAANMFASGTFWAGRTIDLIGDQKSLAQCRSTFVQITGKKPLSIPLPVSLFKKAAGEEMIVLWQWLRAWMEDDGPVQVQAMIHDSHQLVPDLLDVESWIRSQTRPAPNHLPAQKRRPAATRE